MTEKIIQYIYEFKDEKRIQFAAPNYPTKLKVISVVSKNEKKFQASIKKGARIITSSGIHGKIVDLIDSDNTCVIETGAGKIKFERSSISMELSKKYLPKEDKKK